MSLSQPYSPNGAQASAQNPKIAPVAPSPTASDAVPAIPGRARTRFVPLVLSVGDAVERGEIDADALAVLVWLLMRAKRGSDDGVVWACSTTASTSVVNLTRKRAKAALERLELGGHIRRFRQPGSRSNYPIIIDGYVVFRSGPHPWVVSAQLTEDWRHPSSVRSPQGAVAEGPREGSQPVPREAPCTGPPLSEPGTTNPEIETVSLAACAAQSNPIHIDDSRGDRADHGSGGGTAALDQEPDDIRELVRAFAVDLPTLPQPRHPTAPGLRRSIRGALRREAALDTWRALFRRVAQSPWLLGDNDRGWRADLLWLLKPENIAKIEAGRFDRRAANAGATDAPPLPAREARLRSAALTVLARHQVRPEGMEGQREQLT